MAASLDDLEFDVTGDGTAPIPIQSSRTQGPDPIYPSDYVTKSWCLNTIAGGGITYTGVSPISVVAAAISMSPAAVGASGYVTTGVQTFAGVKTFNSLPQVPLLPLVNADVSSKSYVDTSIAGVISGIGALSATSPLSLAAGVLSMTPANAGASGYVTTGAQDINGVKSFVNLPTIPLTPLLDTDAASKGYVDSTVTTTTVNLSMTGAVTGLLSANFIKTHGFVWMTTEQYLGNANATVDHIAITGIPVDYQKSAGRVLVPIIISNSLNNQISQALYTSPDNIGVFGGLNGETFTINTPAYFQVQMCWMI